MALNQWITDSLVVHASSQFLQCRARGANSEPPELALPTRLQEVSLWFVVAGAHFSNFRNNLRTFRRWRHFSVSRKTAWGPTATMAVAVGSPRFRHRILRFSV